jgi:hypothetical protein
LLVQQIAEIVPSVRECRIGSRRRAQCRLSFDIAPIGSQHISEIERVAPIERVEVNTGGAWHQANLIGGPSQQAWQRWELVTCINAIGPAVLRARAMDCEGRVQPEHAEWNRLGYGNNSIQEVTIRVV